MFKTENICISSNHSCLWQAGQPSGWAGVWSCQPTRAPTLGFAPKNSLAPLISKAQLGSPLVAVSPCAWIAPWDTGTVYGWGGGSGVFLAYVRNIFFFSWKCREGGLSPQVEFFFSIHVFGGPSFVVLICSSVLAWSMVFGMLNDVVSQQLEKTLT